jgi:hypothetical protein
VFVARDGGNEIQRVRDDDDDDFPAVSSSSLKNKTHETTRVAWWSFSSSSKKRRRLRKVEEKCGLLQCFCPASVCKRVCVSRVY